MQPWGLFLRILLVVPDYPPYNQGGGGTMYRIIANRLAQRGHEITILAGYYGNNIKEEKSQDSDAIKIIWIPLMKVPISKLSKLRDSLPPSPRSLYFLARFDFAKFDVIHLMAFGHLIIDCINILSYSKKKDSDYTWVP